MALVVLLVSTSLISVSAQPTDKFLIYDGQAVYETERTFQEYIEEYDIEWEMRTKFTEDTTVTNVGPDTVRFSKEVTLKIISAYQKVEGTRYSPESYGFAYEDEEENILRWFNHTDTHTALFVRDVSKTTGMRVRTENPMGLTWVDTIAFYDVPGGYGSTWDWWGFGTTLTHSDLYYENASLVHVGDHTMGGIVSDFTTILGRRAIVVTAEDIPTGTMEFVDKSYYDVTSGLLLKQEYVYVTSNIEHRETRSLTSQTVLDMTTPTIDNPSDLTFDEGATDQRITWHPADAHPDIYNITQDGVLVVTGAWDGAEISVNVSELSTRLYEYTCAVSDESGQSAYDTVRVTVLEAPSETTPEAEKETVSEEAGFIPSFTTVPAVLGLAVLLWVSRRFKK